MKQGKYLKLMHLVEFKGFHVQHKAQITMVGKLKILVLLFLFLFGSCKKQNNLAINGKQLITQKINILIDSIEGFDMSKIPRPEKFKKIKIEKFTVGLLDSILVLDDKLDGEITYNRFNLEKEDLIRVC